MMINIKGIIRHNIELMEIILSTESPFTSRIPGLTSGKLKRFANVGIITKLGYDGSIVKYKLTNHQRIIINEVLNKL